MYRPVTIPTARGPETFHARIDDRAVGAWLAERPRLRACGYPDRPPDVDTPTLRLWLPRAEEVELPYFRDVEQAARVVDVFPVVTASWHDLGGSVTKVLVTG